MFFFSLFAIAPHINLYTTHKREIGRQFFRNLLSFLPFGRQVIIHCRNDVERHCFSKHLFAVLTTKYFNLTQKTFKNSEVIPSIPRVLLCFIVLRTVLNSHSVIGLPKPVSLTFCRGYF